MTDKCIWHSWEEDPIIGKCILVKSAFSEKAFIGTAKKNLNYGLKKQYEIVLKEDSCVSLDGKYAKEWCYYEDFCINANIVIEDERLEGDRHDNHSVYRNKSEIEDFREAMMDRLVGESRMLLGVCSGDYFGEY